MKLYYHKTDGGAEYLCASPVKGTKEGDLYTVVARLDGQPELTILYGAAPDMAKALKALVAVAQRGLDQSATHDGLTNCDALAQARAALKKAGV